MDREAVINQALDATTSEEIAKAKSALLQHLRENPEDDEARGAGEQLEMMRMALEEPEVLTL